MPLTLERIAELRRVRWECPTPAEMTELLDAAAAMLLLQEAGEEDATAGPDGGGWLCLPGGDLLHGFQRGPKYPHPTPQAAVLAALGKP